MNETIGNIAYRVSPKLIDLDIYPEAKNLALLISNADKSSDGASSEDNAEDIKFGGLVLQNVQTRQLYKNWKDKVQNTKLKYIYKYKQIKTENPNLTDREIYAQIADDINKDVNALKIEQANIYANNEKHIVNKTLRDADATNEKLKSQYAMVTQGQLYNGIINENDKVGSTEFFVGYTKDGKITYDQDEIRKPMTGIEYANYADRFLQFGEDYNSQIVINFEDARAEINSLLSNISPSSRLTQYDVTDKGLNTIKVGDDEYKINIKSLREGNENALYYFRSYLKKSLSPNGERAIRHEHLIKRLNGEGFYINSNDELLKNESIRKAYEKNKKDAISDDKTKKGKGAKEEYVFISYMDIPFELGNSIYLAEKANLLSGIKTVRKREDVTTASKLNSNSSGGYGSGKTEESYYNIITAMNKNRIGTDELVGAISSVNSIKAKAIIMMKEMVNKFTEWYNTEGVGLKDNEIINKFNEIKSGFNSTKYNVDNETYKTYMNMLQIQTMKNKPPAIILKTNDGCVAISNVGTNKISLIDDKGKTYNFDATTNGVNNYLKNQLGEKNAFIVRTTSHVANYHLRGANVGESPKDNVYISTAKGFVCIPRNLSSKFIVLGGDKLIEGIERDYGGYNQNGRTRNDLVIEQKVYIPHEIAKQINITYETQRGIKTTNLIEYYRYLSEIGMADKGDKFSEEALSMAIVNNFKNGKISDEDYIRTAREFSLEYSSRENEHSMSLNINPDKSKGGIILTVYQNMFDAAQIANLKTKTNNLVNRGERPNPNNNINNYIE